MVSELIRAVNEIVLDHPHKKCHVPLAVVMNKVDALPTGEYPYLDRLISNNGSPAAPGARCRAALERLGEGPALRALEQKFSRVQYFACSALGRIPNHRDKEPFEASGVIDPFLWLLELEGSSHAK